VTTPDQTPPQAHPCDTYTVWSPTACTVTARCYCGWHAPTRPQWDVVGAARDEMDHLLDALNSLNPEPDEQRQEAA
jgi:hypothetical protein